MKLLRAWWKSVRCNHEKSSGLGGTLLVIQCARCKTRWIYFPNISFPSIRYEVEPGVYDGF